MPEKTVQEVEVHRTIIIQGVGSIADLLQFQENPASAKVLIAQRCPGIYDGGRWEVIGGKKEPGDLSRFETIFREVAEESGLRVVSTLDPKTLHFKKVDNPTPLIILPKRRFREDIGNPNTDTTGTYQVHFHLGNVAPFEERDICLNPKEHMQCRCANLDTLYEMRKNNELRGSTLVALWKLHEVALPEIFSRLTRRISKA
ncbi:MAG: NUDIX domain-containing protein [Patescibacteria group bacterium]